MIGLNRPAVNVCFPGGKGEEIHTHILITKLILGVDRATFYNLQAQLYIAKTLTPMQCNAMMQF